MKRAYRFFLLLYPLEHQDQFADEMTAVFEAARAEGCMRGWTWYMRFAFAEMNGLIAGAASTWFTQRFRNKPAPQSSGAAASPCALPQELIDAKQRVDLNVAGMIHAIATHQFAKARFHSDEERQARECLRLLQDKYEIQG